MSYILCRRGWGHGYATEAAAVARDWMLAVHLPDRLVSHVAPANAASARVAAKLGAGRDGFPLDIWRHRPTG